MHSCASIPDAKVTLQNQDTKISTTTQTSADGTFVVPGLVVQPLDQVLREQAESPI